MFNTSIPDHFINMLKSHHFTFLWGSLPMLPSNWLSYVPCATIYSTIAQCNSCTFHSLFFWSSVLSKPKLKLILTSIIRSKTLESTQVLNAPILNIFLKFFFLKKSEGLSTDLFRQSNFKHIFRHFVKGIKNRLLKAAKLKSCKILSKWISAICTMVWFVLYNCGGSIYNIWLYLYC